MLPASLIAARTAVPSRSEEMVPMYPHDTPPSTEEVLVPSVAVATAVTAAAASVVGVFGVIPKSRSDKQMV